MKQPPEIDWKSVLVSLEDLADMVHYYCIGIYRVKDSFVDESLARARTTIEKIKKQLVEVSNENSQTSNSSYCNFSKNRRK